MFYKKATMKAKYLDKEKEIYLSQENEDEVNSFEQDVKMNSLVLSEMAINTFNHINNLNINFNLNSGIQDEDSSLINYQRILSSTKDTEGAEVKMFEKNKQIYSNLKPV